MGILPRYAVLITLTATVSIFASLSAGKAATPSAPSGISGFSPQKSAFSLNDQRLITVSAASGRIHVLNGLFESLAEVSTTGLPAGIAHNGKIFLSLDEGTGQARAFDAAGEHGGSWPLPADLMEITDVGSNGRQVAILDASRGVIEILDFMSGKPLASVRSANSAVVAIDIAMGLLWQFDGHLLATDPFTGELLTEFSLPGAGLCATGTAGIAVDGALLLACRSGRISRIDITSGENLASIDAGIQLSAFAVAEQTLGLDEVIFSDSFEAPPITLVSPQGGATVSTANINLVGEVSVDVDTLTINAQPAPIIANAFNFPVVLSEGANLFNFEATLNSGGTATLLATIHLDSTPPDPANTAFVEASEPDAGQSTVTGFPGSVEALATVRITNLRKAQVVVVSADATGGFLGSIGAQGSDELSIEVIDAGGLTSPPVSVFVPDPNNAPVLAAIGAQSVDLGASITFTINATDDDGDPLVYSANPLPANASLDAGSGEFHFRPAAEQTGDFDIDFMASDGMDVDSEVVTLTAVPPPPDGITMLTGRVLDTTDFVDSQLETPVTGATVSILNSGVSISTDVDGEFTLAAVPHGSQIFDIDPSLADVAPDGSSYSGFREELHIIEKANNIIDRPLFLPRIDASSETVIDPNNTTVVSNASLGVSISIPPHTAKKPDGTDYAGVMSISEVPDAVAPAALPEELGFGLLITIQPVGVYFRVPVAITFPNTDGHAPNSEMDIWSLDPQSGQFIVVGRGRVDSFGTTITTISGGVLAADWHGPLSTGVKPRGEDTEKCDYCAKLKQLGGSDTFIHSGNLQVEHALPTYRSRQKERGLTFVYNSEHADPRPVITGISQTRGQVPATVSVGLEVAGTDSGQLVFYDTSGLSANTDFVHALQFDARALPTGRYVYQSKIGSNYTFSTTVALLSGKLLINNRINSEFGAGWGLTGLHRLHEQPDQGVLLEEGDGSLRLYNPLFAGDGTFEGTLSLAIGSDPKNFVTGDFNKDTFPDFAVINGNSVVSCSAINCQRLSIFLGDGAGDFSLVQIILPGQPNFLAAGDIDSDTFIDFVVIDINGVWKIINDQVGGWQSPVQIPRDAGNTDVRSGKGVVLGLFNADAHLDIVYPNYNQNDAINHIDMLLSNGPGTWDFATQVVVGNDPQYLVAADFNNDTKLDLAVANLSSDDISILLGDGTGTMTPAAVPAVPGGNGPRYIVVEDYNGDTFLDMAVVPNQTSNLTITVLRGDGTGAFDAPSEVGVGSVAVAVATGHFNADDNIDLAVLNQFSQSVSILLGTGAGGFPIGQEFNVGEVPDYLAVMDTNGDGFDDVLVSNRFSDSISILRGRGDGTMINTARSRTQTGGNDLVSADFNNDRRPDIAVATQGRVEIFLTDINGDLQTAVLSSVSKTSDQMGLGDFDNDGFMDLAFINGSTNSVVVEFGDGTGAVANHVNSPVTCDAGVNPCSPLSITATDFNGDGVQDVIILKNDTSVETLQVMFGDGSGTLNPGPEMVINGIPERIRAADMNNDGLPDLGITDRFDRIAVVLNDTNGDFEPETSVAIGDDPREFNFGDFNNDGNIDMAATSNGDDELHIMLGDGLGAFAVQVPISLVDFLGSGTDPRAVATADFNGDGNQDLAIGLLTSGEMLLMEGDGAGGFSPGERQMLDARPEALVAADLDINGVTDLVAVSPNSATVVVLKGNASANMTGLRTPEADFSSLVKNLDDSYTRSLQYGDIEQYDSLGQLTSVSDRNGNTSIYAYNGAGQLMSISDPVGKVTTLAYSGDRLSSTTDPASRTSTFEYDASGNLTRITDPDLTQREFSYDSSNRMVLQLSKRGFPTAYEYNFAGQNTKVILPDGTTNLFEPTVLSSLVDPASGMGTDVNPALAVSPAQVEGRFTDGNGGIWRYGTNRFDAGTSEIDPLGHVTTLMRTGANLLSHVEFPDGTMLNQGFDISGNQISVVAGQGLPEEQTVRFQYDNEFHRMTKFSDPAGNSATVEYDDAGNATRFVNQGGGEELFVHNGAGQLTSLTDANTNTTTYTYDTEGNRETVTNALGEVVKLVRDSAGNVTETAHAFGTSEAISETFTYDSMNRLTSQTDGAGITEIFRYDTAGNVIEEESGTGEITRIQYDSRDRISRVESTLSGNREFDYDGNSNLLILRDGFNQETHYEYDADDRLTLRVDPDGTEQLLTYDALERVITTTDGRGNVTGFQWDALSRITKVTDALTGERTYSYEPRGMLSSVTDPLGEATSFQYDDLMRATQVDVTGNTLLFTYDAVGKLLTATDGDTSMGFEYDAIDRVRQERTITGGIQPVVTLDYSYNQRGDWTGLIDSERGASTYSYDDAGRLTTINTAEADVIGLSYDSAGRTQSITYPNLTEAGKTYDANGRLQVLSHDFMGTTNITSFTFGFDDNGNINAIAEPLQSRVFTYDSARRLTGGGTVGAPESYSYDVEGNRSSSHLSAAYIYDDANRLTEDDQFTYNYDANGRLIQRDNKFSADVEIFDYDPFGQLIQYTAADTTVTSYRYDALGRRVEKNVSGQVTRYVYLAEHIRHEYDGLDNLQASYDYSEKVDQPLMMRRSGMPYFYHSDHLGSIVAITNSAGAVVNDYQYDAFGQLTVANITVANPYHFAGRELDTESGLHFLRSRYYEPSVGRFITQDPLGVGGGDSNLYQYVGANPVNFVDPFGLLKDPFDKFKRGAALTLGGALPGPIGEAISAYALQDALETDKGDVALQASDWAIAAFGLSNHPYAKVINISAGLGRATIDSYSDLLDNENEVSELAATRKVMRIKRRRSLENKRARLKLVKDLRRLCEKQKIEQRRAKRKADRAAQKERERQKRLKDKELSDMARALIGEGDPPPPPPQEPPDDIDSVIDDIQGVIVLA